MSSVEEIVALGKKYANIMKDIAKLLEKKKIEFQNKQAEIIIPKKKKKDIMRIITSLIDEKEAKYVLDVVATKQATYIRKKLK